MSGFESLRAHSLKPRSEAMTTAIRQSVPSDLPTPFQHRGRLPCRAVSSMKGHNGSRPVPGAVVDVGVDPIASQRRTVNRTVHASCTKRGAQQADAELAKLVAEVTTGHTTPTSGITVRQLVERYVRDRSPGGTPGQADAVRQRAENHIYPHRVAAGDVAKA